MNPGLPVLLLEPAHCDPQVENTKLIVPYPPLLLSTDQQRIDSGTTFDTNIAPTGKVPSYVGDG